MKFNKSYLVFCLALIVALGSTVIAQTVISPFGGNGVHRIINVATDGNDTNDTGVGFYNLKQGNGDSGINYGVYFAHIPTTGVARLHDTVLAEKGALSGSAKVLEGRVLTSGQAVLKSQITTTRSIVISETFTDSTVVAQGTWTSGTTSDTFLWPADLSDVPLVFYDSTGFTFSSGLQDSALFTNADPINTSVIIFDTRISSSTDSARIIVINDQNQVAADSSMTQISLASGQNGLIAAGIQFDTGLSKVIVLFWDADSRNYSFKTSKVTIGPNAAPQSMAGASGQTDSIATMVDTIVGSSVRSCTVQTSFSIKPVIASIQILDVGNDTSAAGDAYTRYDLATSNFDTRLAGSVFTITPYDANGNKISAITSDTGVSCTVLINPGVFQQMSQTQVDQLGLIHLNDATGEWEAVEGSNADSATNMITANNIKAFSHFGVGNLSAGHGEGSSSDCVIDNALSGTALSTVMPSIRSARDSVMTSSFGRMLVSSYYSIAGLLLLFAGAASLAFTGARKN
ncbi:MAG: hypothetical protein JKX97_05825 [Candidatus Lindowbacteria bacterium]|nr:hypothetical protein [Candidatus Lindowbacteria bacterium]